MYHLDKPRCLPVFSLVDWWISQSKMSLAEPKALTYPYIYYIINHGSTQPVHCLYFLLSIVIALFTLRHSIVIRRQDKQFFNNQDKQPLSA